MKGSADSSSVVSAVVVIFFMFASVSVGQLSPSETRVLLRVQGLLENPEVLRTWTNWTSFCYLPSSPTIKIACSKNHVTELTIIGNKSSPSHRPKPTKGNFIDSGNTLSKKFSIDAFFTVLTKLSELKALSLVSLGLWGPLPSKIDRFKSLEVLNISSNFIYGEIPREISSFKSLKSLVLADNLFNGSIPDLKGLAALQELDLSNNHLGPEFPSLRTNLVSIILRNNSLRSEMPPQLKKFDRVQHFDISHNEFAGPIPSFLFSLPSIQYLSLASNKFSGALPKDMSCSKKLKYVDMSRNLLIGKLPSCILPSSSKRTIILWWNCFSGGDLKYQRPYSYCSKEAMAVKPPSDSNEQGPKIKLSILIAVVGGILGVVGLSILLALLLVRSSKYKRSKDANYEPSPVDKISVPSYDSRNVPQTMRSPALALPAYQVFTYEEIEDATNNFNPLNFIGEGSRGQLYKGRLRDGSMVHVTCLKLKHRILPQSLTKHMEILPKLRHQHLVRILGHCIEDHSRTGNSIYIVQEKPTTTSLKNHLEDWKKKEALNWSQRMAAIVGVTKGLHFLHAGIAPGIFGNNLKIDNILLDDSLTAKISKYDIPLLHEIDAAAQKDSNHLGSTKDAEKEDIFQLGVILLEVITGRLVTSSNELNELKLQLERSITEHASRLRILVDPDIQGTYAYQSLRTVAEIAMNCLCSDSSKRPSMEDVLWNLQYSVQVQEGWANSGNLSMQINSGNLSMQM